MTRLSSSMRTVALTADAIQYDEHLVMLLIKAGAGRYDTSDWHCQVD